MAMKVTKKNKNYKTIDESSIKTNFIQREKKRNKKQTYVLYRKCINKNILNFELII